MCLNAKYRLKLKEKVNFFVLDNFEKQRKSAEARNSHNPAMYKLPY